MVIITLHPVMMFRFPPIIIAQIKAGRGLFSLPASL